MVKKVDSRKKQKAECRRGEGRSSNEKQSPTTSNDTKHKFPQVNEEASSQEKMESSIDRSLQMSKMQIMQTTSSEQELKDTSENHAMKPETVPQQQTGSSSDDPEDVRDSDLAFPTNLERSSRSSRRPGAYRVEGIGRRQQEQHDQDESDEIVPVPQPPLHVTSSYGFLVTATLVESGRHLNDGMVSGGGLPRPLPDDSEATTGSISTLEKVSEIRIADAKRMDEVHHLAMIFSKRRNVCILFVAVSALIGLVVGLTLLLSSSNLPPLAPISDDEFDANADDFVFFLERAVDRDRLLDTRYVSTHVVEWGYETSGCDNFNEFPVMVLTCVESTNLFEATGQLVVLDTRSDDLVECIQLEDSRVECYPIRTDLETFSATILVACGEEETDDLSAPTLTAEVVESRATSCEEPVETILGESQTTVVHHFEGMIRQWASIGRFCMSENLFADEQIALEGNFECESGYTITFLPKGSSAGPQSACIQEDFCRAELSCLADNDEVCDGVERCNVIAQRVLVADQTEGCFLEKNVGERVDWELFDLWDLVDANFALGDQLRGQVDTFVEDIGPQA